MASNVNWDALNDSVSAGGCAYQEVLKAIISVLVDKTVVAESEVVAAIDTATTQVAP